MKHTTHNLLRGTVALTALAVSASVASAQVAGLENEQLDGVGITQNIGDELPLETPFVRATGEATTLGDQFSGEIPVILTLNYVDCPQLCSMQLTGLATAMGEIGLELGSDYRVVTVSIDPKDTPEKAAGMEKLYLTRYADASVEAETERKVDAAALSGWTYLVGDEANIQTVADAAGFGFRWVEKSGEYAHSAATIVCSPEGVITHYLPGIVQPEEASKLLRPALVEASEGRVGTLMDRIFLNCFIFDPEKGHYVLAFRLLRVAAALTVIAVITGMFLMRRAETQRTPGGASAANAPEETHKQ